MDAATGIRRETQSFQRLWQKVILQAVMDAESNIATSQARAGKLHARAWLTGSSPDFTMVCELAGFDPQDIRARFQQYFTQPSLFRWDEVLAVNEKGQLYVKDWA